MAHEFRVYLNFTREEYDQVEIHAAAMRKTKAAYVKDLVLTSWKNDHASDFRDLKQRLNGIGNRTECMTYLLRKLTHDSSMNLFRINSVLDSLPTGEQVQLRSEMANFVERRMEAIEEVLSHLTHERRVE